MKKERFKLGILLFSFLAFAACSSDDGMQDPDPGTGGPVTINNPDQDIDNFIWNGMNAAYLYKSEVSDLANDRFGSNQDLFQFLSTFSSPEETFNGLRTKRSVTVNGETFLIDPFSFIVDDYVALEQAFSGVSKSNGMDFGLSLYPDGSDNVLGFVRYILPGTDAETKGLKRGDIFTTINGTQITRSNFRDLLALENYSIGLATLNGSIITPTGTTVELIQAEYTENPIFIAKTIEYQGQKIGYLMYNSFVGDFDVQLNEAFGKFKTDGITDLILDLRYNGGGLVRSAIDLSSMITGQFNGEIFSKEIWNAELQAQFSSGANGAEALINRFRDKIHTDAPINSLNLAKLHVLTTDRSASASELVINGLDPYIDVVQIGETTAGKYQASVTLYDSNGFGREGANPAHTYAIQPLVLKSANANDVTDYVTGLAPEVPFTERISNMGVLGEVTEPFLKAALDHITGGVITAAKSGFDFEIVDWETKSALPTYQKMYIDESKFTLAKRTIDQE